MGELCTFSKGHGYSKADIRDAGTPLILYGRLYTQYESRIEEVDTFAVGQDGSMLSRGNEVIVPASGETAEDIAVASSVRRSGIILGGDLNVVTPTSKLDPDYTALAITYSKAHDDLAKRAQGKSVVHVHGNDIAEIEVSYPSESEQKRISSVVLDLDSLITLHQRKHDKLVQLKKSMLDKMFPKPGETEPEIRFAGFTDPWEQRKLGDCFDFLQNNTLSRADLNLESGSARNIHYGDILIKFGDCLGLGSDKLPFVDDESILSKYVNSTLRVGDIIFADTAEDESAGKCVELVELPNEPVISGLHTIPVRPKFPFGSGYLGHYLNAPAYHDQLLPLMQGVKVISVSKTTLQDTQICFPTVSEQSAIGASLNALDFLITLHQRKRRKRLSTHPLVWEQRKLGELYSLVSEKNDLTFGRESIISVANMYFNANVNIADEQYLRTYNVMRFGDIAFEGHSNKEFSHGRFVENYIGDGIVSHIFTVLRPRVPLDVNYWRYAINNEKLMRLSLIRSTKASTMMHDLVPSDFLREAIPTPTLAEQKEIGAFLVGLDHLITLHQ